MKQKSNKGGRPPLTNPAKNRYVFYLNDMDKVRFETLFESSGMKTYSHFIIARIFAEEFKVITVNKTKIDYYTKLSNFLPQYRAIGVNYNQVVKVLNTHFSEGKAMRMLYSLENQTKELISISQKIILLTEEFKKEVL